MRTFSSGITITPNLQEVATGWGNAPKHWKGDLNTTIQHIFSEKVLSKLEVLSIRGKDRKMMTRQYSELFLKLKDLTITEFDVDDESSTVFPSNFIYGLHNLEKLCIENSSFEEIFPCEGEGEGEEPSLQLLLPHLTALRLVNLAELKYICTENSPFFPILLKLTLLEISGCPALTNLLPTGSVSFKLLTYLHVEDCGGLMYLISSSAVAASLENLKTLIIRGCEMIEEIVAADHHSESQQDHHHEEIIITFSKLQQLGLGELPRLTSFCTANSYTFNFPELEVVYMTECPNMRTFSSGITITPNLQEVRTKLGSEYQLHRKGDLNTIIQHAFSLMELSKLEVLSIKGKDMKMTTRHSKLLVKLRGLTITEFDEGDESSIVFPSNFIYGLHNLTYLKVMNSSFEEIFPYEGEGDGEGEGEEPSLQLLLPHLTSLWLENLPEMKYICTENSPFFPILHKLERLGVVKCHGLTNLLPTTSLSFQFLIKLTVKDCSGLINLIPSSVAVASLEQLRDLVIKGCEMLEEIVAADHHSPSHSQQDHHHEEILITFSKLQQLKLEELPRLTSFCTANNYTFNFPALERVFVRECPNMRTFSPGITITPNLQEVRTVWGNEYQLHRKGDLNTIIQYAFSQMEFSKLEVMSIRGKDMKMMMMMTRQYSELFLKLRDLTITEFDDGDESSTVFPSNFIYGLHNLTYLKVTNSSFKEIFPYEGEGEESSLLLPHLTHLWLMNLPEMKYICTEKSPFFPILHKLNWLEITGCPGLTNAVPTASLSFKFLIKLIVVECGGLINLISSSAAASLEQLRELKILGCEMIEEIVAADHHSLSLSHSQSQQAHHHHEDIIITFSKLCHLELQYLPRLTSLCTANNYTFNFPELVSVTVIECPNMRTFSPGITITPMLQQVFTGWSNDQPNWQWKDDLNTTIQHIFSQMVAQRLTSTDPSTSLNNHVEPEAQSHEKPIESTVKEAEEIREVGKKAEISENDIRPENEIEPRNGTDICEEVVEGGKVAVDSCEKGKGKELDTESCKSDLNTDVQHLCSEMATSPNNYIEPIESDRNESEISMEATGPGNEAEVDAFEKGKGKAIEICEEEVVEAVGNEGQTLNHPFLESDMPQKSRLSSLRHMPFFERGESSVLPEQQSEKLEETTPAEAHEEQTGAGSLASQSSTSPETSHSLQKNVHGLRGTKGSISLLSEFLRILQTQPLNSMSSEQFQFIENAFRDLSNISIDWFSPYVEKAREFSLVIDRSKKISEIEAQLQALKEEKRVLEEKNEAVASCVDLDKPLLDN